MKVNDEAMGRGQSCRRRGGGRGRGGRKTKGKYCSGLGIQDAVATAVRWGEDGLSLGGREVEGGQQCQWGSGGRRRRRRRQRWNVPSGDVLRCSVHGEDSGRRRRDGDQKGGNCRGRGSRHRRGGVVPPEGTGLLVSPPCCKSYGEQRQRWGRKMGRSRGIGYQE